MVTKKQEGKAYAEYTMQTGSYAHLTAHDSAAKRTKGTAFAAEQKDCSQLIIVLKNTPTPLDLEPEDIQRKHVSRSKSPASGRGTEIIGQADVP